MNIKTFFSKLLNNKEHDLVLQSDLVSIAMRDSLDEVKKVKLDEYKKAYLNILSQKKYISIYDIAMSDYNEEIRMNFQLFGRIVINNDSDYNLMVMDKDEIKELWLKQYLAPRKIELYINEMAKISDEAHLRLIALKEIYEEYGNNLAKNKRNAILSEIYNLTGNYVAFKGNLFAASLEVGAYKNRPLVSKDGESILNEKDTEMILRQHEEELVKYFKKYMPEKLENDMDPAYMERELEIYAYKNADLDSLNIALSEIDSIKKNLSNKSMLLERINNLEEEYIFLNEYGGYELDLKPLYEVKFDILTINLVNEETPFKYSDNAKAQKYYASILADRIVTNITGADSLLSQWVDAKNRNVISLIASELKYKFNGREYYDYIYLLNNKFLLAFILSLASREETKYFFENCKFNLDSKEAEEYFNIGTSTEEYKLQEKGQMSYGALFAINRLSPTSTSMMVSNWTEIYSLLVDSSEKTFFEIPEGIKKIRFYKDSYEQYGRLRQLINNKILVTPSTLEVLDLSGLNLGELYFPGILLKEGLKKCNLEGYFNENSQLIIIPSTLESFWHSICSYRKIPIRRDSSILGTVSDLTFTNFENSNIFNNDGTMRDIIWQKCGLIFSQLYKHFEGKPFSYYAWEYEIPKPKVKELKISLVSVDGSETKILISDIIEMFYLSAIRKYVTTIVSERKYVNYIREDDLTTIYAETHEQVISECQKKIQSIIQDRKGITKSLHK